MFQDKDIADESTALVRSPRNASLTTLPPASLDTMGIEDVLLFADTFAQNAMIIDWGKGAVASRLAQEPDANSEQICQLLATQPDRLASLVVAHRQFPAEEREPGVSPEAHAEVYNEIILPLGDSPEVRAEARKVLGELRASPVPTRSMRAILRQRRKDIISSLQLTLMDSPPPTSHHKDSEVGDDPATQWEMLFFRRGVTAVYAIHACSGKITDHRLYEVQGEGFDACMKTLTTNQIGQSSSHQDLMRMASTRENNLTKESSQ